jgi:hypothetical protein
LKVLSITAPSSTRFSFERTKAPPLPGLTCWNSTMRKTVPSTSMWAPFLNWLVLITARKASRRGVSGMVRSDWGTKMRSAASSLSRKAERNGVFGDRHGRIRHLLRQLRP